MSSKDDTPPRRPGSEQLCDALVEAGVDLLVGLPGTQTLPLDRSVEQRDDIRYVMARHETAIPHVAWGHYEADGGVAATLTVPGPGDTNAMHGLKNALDDRVPILHVAAVPDPEDRGKGPIHEIDPSTYDNVVKRNVTVERPTEFHRAVHSGIEAALTSPCGPVRLGIPKRLLDDEFTSPPIVDHPGESNFDRGAEYRIAIDALAAAERPLVYLGVGARRSEDPASIRALIETLNAPVLASLKGKGVFPEDDPRFLGISGSHLPAAAVRTLDAADVVLALGTRFDGVTTADWSLPMGDTLVHVTRDTERIDVAYDADVAIVEAVDDAVEQFRAGLRSRSRSESAWNGAAVADRARAEYAERLDELGLLGDETPLRTPAVLRTLRDVLPSETVVTTDVGGFRLWAAQLFETTAPGTYVTAGSWAGMGVGLPAALGAKLSSPDRPVVALHGDGGLMMCLQELHTAVEYDLDVITVVFNNADYGVISKSSEIDRFAEGHRFAWDSPDFAAIAEGFGCRGTSVETLAGVRETVERALERSDGPELIDVRVDPDGPTAAAAADYESALEFPDTSR